ncbi:MAG: GNAT family N-acetyltransferase [Paenibacillaceae bacterium]
MIAYTCGSYLKSGGIYIIREALSSEASLLSQLAFESKSYWQYDQEYLVAAREQIKITYSDIEQDYVYLYEDEQGISGFYHFMNIQCDPELVWFFVHPKSIGTGIGKILWNHLLELIRNLEINEFMIKSDPNAESFYIKHGATRIGWKPSSVKGDMKLPLLKYIDKTVRA